LNGFDELTPWGIHLQKNPRPYSIFSEFFANGGWQNTIAALS
jgi:hypothetical protein